MGRNPQCLQPSASALTAVTLGVWVFQVILFVLAGMFGYLLCARNTLVLYWDNKK